LASRDGRKDCGEEPKTTGDPIEAKHAATLSDFQLHAACDADLYNEERAKVLL
jgi:hypothetical protein